MMFSLPLFVLVALQTTFDVATAGYYSCSGPDGSLCSLFLGMPGCCCGSSCWVAGQGPCGPCSNRLNGGYGERTNDLITVVKVNDEKELACLGGAAAADTSFGHFGLGRQAETVSSGFRSQLVLWGAIALMGAVLFGGVWAYTARKAEVTEMV